MSLVSWSFQRSAVALRRLAGARTHVVNASFSGIVAPSSRQYYQFAGLQVSRSFRTSTRLFAVTPFKLADIGEGISEVKISEWFIKEGDKVKEMDRLCTVESDKASVEITSRYTGTIVKLYGAVDDSIKVGATLVDIETEGGGPAPAEKKAPAKKAPAAKKEPAPAASGGGGGVQPFKLADIGEGIAEVTVTEWFVKEGDTVKEMDKLCMVESDKASVEITSRYAGKIVKIHSAKDEIAKVGGVLCDIETAGGGPAPPKEKAAPAPKEKAAPAPKAAAPKPAAPAAAPAKAASAAGVLAVPKVRALAREKGIDLTTIQGTGAAGRVLEADVLKALEAPAKAAPAAPGVAAPARPAPRPGQEEVVPITDMVGKAMVKSMNDALKVPYMALGEELDLTNMLALQKSLKEHSLKKHGVKLTLTAFIIKCISLALTENPKINTKFGPEAADPPYYTMFGSHNISIAIDTKNGLMVPNIKDVGNLSVLEIQSEIMRLVEAAQANKLSFDDIKGGTISFSNVGVIGTKDPRPILFDGQCCIGAIGRLQTLPRYDEKMNLVPRSIAHVRWVADHRHVDGATLAHYSNSFKRYVENPGAWTLTLK